MNLLTIDHIIVYVFLAITLVVGLYYGRGIKTLRNFAVADRSYSSVIITITLIATMVGAGTAIGNIVEAVNSNFLFIFPLLGAVFGIILLSVFIAPKFDERFRDCISIGDVLGEFLSKTEIKISCFTMCIQGIGVLGAQFIVMAHLCKDFLGLSYEASVFLTSSIVIFYSTFGGIRSVTITDVLQFFVLMITIPLISAVLLSKAQVKSYDFSAHFNYMFSNNIKIIDYFALTVFWIIPLHILQAPLVQRYLMVKSMKVKLSKITMGFGLVKALMLLMLLVTATSLLKLQPLENSSEIISVIFQSYLPSGIRGLVLAGMLAVIMSSADSFLNASSVLLVKNLLPESITKDEKKSLSLTKISTLIIGITALLMALQNFRPVALMVYTQTLLVTGSSVPLMAGLFGFKVNRESFWICLMTAFITYSTSKYLLPEFEYIHSLFTLITSVSAFFISHYIINGGFAFDPAMKPTPSRVTKKKPFVIPNFKTLEKNIFRKFTRSTKALTLFAAFCYFNFLYNLFSFATTHEGEYIEQYHLFVIALSAFFCTLLLLKDMWSIEDQKKYLAKGWLFSLCFCIPFSSTVLLAATHGEIYSVVLLTLGLLLLSYLVDWFLLIIISIVGIVLGCLFEWALFGNLYIDIPNHTYIASLISLIVVGILIKTRQNENEEKFKTLELFGGAMAHEAKSPMNSFVMNNYLLKEITEDFIVLEHDENNYKIQLSTAQYEMLKELPDFNETIGKSGRVAVDLLLLAMRNEEMKDVEDFGEYSVKACVDETIKEFVIDKKQKSLISIDVKKDFTFEGSKTFMKAIVINLIKNAFKHGGENVTIDITIDKNIIKVRDNGRGIPLDKVDRIFDKYYTGGQGTGIGLALCEKFMESIGGSISCESEVGKYTEFVLEFSDDKT